MQEQNASAAPSKPRRQARGQQRIAQILEAAAAVFAEQGYDSTTTNAIAARAGISPGSLYQYFTNKDDVAHALAEQYASELTRLRAEVFDRATVDATELDAVVSAVLEPLVAFNVAHPGFKALFARTDMPAGLRDAVAPIHAAIHARVAELVGILLPESTPVAVARIATVMIQQVRAMTPLIVEAGDSERDALAHELHKALVGYLRSHRL